MKSTPIEQISIGILHLVSETGDKFPLDDLSAIEDAISQCQAIALLATRGGKKRSFPILSQTVRMTATSANV